MKQCVYCGQDIPDLARKCHLCHSFQSPSDEPKKGFEIAALVISFVGSVAAVATIAAGIFAYVGFTNLKDLNDRAEKIMDRSSAILTSVEDKMKRFDEWATKLAAAEENFRATKRDLNGLLIKEEYDRFERLMDAVALDQLHKTVALVDELREVSNIVSRIQDVPEDATINDEKAEITSIVAAVVLYKEGSYSLVSNALSSSVSDKSDNKHRLMTAAYGKLYERAVRENKPEEAAAYLGQQNLHAQTALELAVSANKSTVIAKVNYAVALISRGEPTDLDKAYELLNDAKKDAPRSGVICYDLAGFCVKKHKLADALSYLEEAKSRGEFSSEADVRFFNEDPWFVELRKTDNQSYRERLETVTKIAP